jgi:hypothetical protein
MAGFSVCFGHHGVYPRPIWFFTVCSIWFKSLFRTRFGMRVLRMQFLLFTCTLPSMFLEKKKRTERHISGKSVPFQNIFMGL